MEHEKQGPQKEGDLDNGAVQVQTEQGIDRRKFLKSIGMAGTATAAAGLIQVGISGNVFGDPSATGLAHGRGHGTVSGQVYGDDPCCEFEPQTWERLNGVSIVENSQYPYGDLRRYGCPCNGTQDDSVNMQKAFDVCGKNNMPIIKPSLPMLLNNPVILRSRATHYYTFIGQDFKSTGNVITVNAEYAFVGEGFYAATPIFTEVILRMEDIAISCSREKDVVVFKAIALYGSMLLNNKFYYPYVLIEGSLTQWPRFEGNRVQAFRRAVIASSSTLPGVTRDAAAAAWVASGYDVSVLAAYLVETGTGTGAFRYFRNSTDTFIRGNYFSGSYSRTVLASVLEVDSIEITVVFTENWFEFAEYVAKPYLFTNTVNTEATIRGCTFINNVFQYFYRALEENTRWRSWVFDHNQLEHFRRAGLQRIFTNVTSAKYLTKKCGPFVMDAADADLGTFFDLRVYDNVLTSDDYFIYLDSGTGVRPHRVKEKGTQIAKGSYPVSNPIYVRLRVRATDVTPFTESRFELLDHRNLPSLPTLSDVSGYYLNTFNGQMLTVAGVPYMAMLGADGFPKYQALT